MKLSFLRYSIPLKSTFKTAKNHFHSRKGIIIQFKKNGITALGEAAPLPGFSVETVEDLRRQIQQYKKVIIQFFKSDFDSAKLYDFLQSSNFSPSLEFGLFTVAIFYLAQVKEKSLHNFLFANIGKTIKMNAVIDAKKRSLLPQARQYINRGFDVLKIKTGNDWGETYPQIQKIGDEYEDLTLRIDANRSWRTDDAAEYLKQAEDLDIEYCEEPLRNITAQKLQTLKEETHIPIALDEAIVRWPEVKELALFADVFIIKPMLLGNYKKIENICDFANKNNKQIVFTSTLGTAIERLATSSLASGLGTKNTAHGLNTGHFLSRDVWDEAPSTNNGKYELPDFNRLKQLMQSDMQNIELIPV